MSTRLPFVGRSKQRRMLKQQTDSSDNSDSELDIRDSSTGSVMEFHTSMFVMAV